MRTTLALLTVYLAWNVQAQLCTPGQYNSMAAMQIITNDYSAIVLDVRSTIITAIGDLNGGANVPAQLTDAKIVLKGSTKRAFACVTSTNITIAWGDGYYGGGATPVAASGNVTSIHGNDRAFAVLKKSGNVVAWGDSRFGGKIPSRVQAAYIVDIASNSQGFVALDDTGVPHIWGYPNCITTDIPHVTVDTIAPQYKLSTALAWADVYCNLVTSPQGSTIADALVLFDTMKDGVIKTVSTTRAFASLTIRNTLQTWGDPLYGGQNDNAHKQLGISDVVSTLGAFGAITETGRVMAWGDTKNGGELPSVLQTVNNAKGITSNDCAFAVFTKDGKVVSWGKRECGGERRIQTTGIKSIVSSSRAFAMLLLNGTVISWGNVAYGGENVWWLTDVSSVHSHSAVFIAIKKGGELVTWGDVSTGARIATTARCVDCPEGTKTQEFRARSCEPCGVRWWSPKGSIRCHPCPFGICNKMHLTIVLTSCVLFAVIILILVHFSPAQENIDHQEMRDIDDNTDGL